MVRRSLDYCDLRKAQRIARNAKTAKDRRKSKNLETRRNGGNGGVRFKLRTMIAKPLYLPAKNALKSVPNRESSNYLGNAGAVFCWAAAGGLWGMMRLPPPPRLP